MDFSGIQSIINRINEIEAKFQAIEPSPQQTVPFQNVLEQAIGQAQPQPAGSPPANGLITYQGFSMTPETAESFGRLEALIRERFPGKSAIITSTTEGKHQDPNHHAGKAVDFVVPGITTDESRILEALSRQAGFVPYNEYIRDSRYKTGPHMHVDLGG